MRKSIQAITALIGLSLCFIWSLIIYYDYNMPMQFSVTQGKELVLDGIVQVCDLDVFSAKQVVAGSENTVQRASLRVFGVFPVKEISVKTVEQPVVVVAGTPFGIKMYTDGVLVVGLSDVETASGPCNPARIAGLKIGDVVLAVNGQGVSTNAALREMIEQSAGEQLELRIRRDNLIFTVKSRAVLSATEKR